MIYLLLFWTFFRIGSFSFGGGYAMIPLISDYLEAYGWMDNKEFLDIVAVSQMTPGPIAVNAATYVGIKAGGYFGATMATLGVALPSFILIIIIAHFFIQFKESQIVESVLKGIRPVTIGMIGSTVVLLAQTSIFSLKSSLDSFFDVLQNISNVLNLVQIDISSLIIFLIILTLTVKFRLSPLLAIPLSAFMGVLPHIALGIISYVLL